MGSAVLFEDIILKKRRKQAMECFYDAYDAQAKKQYQAAVHKYQESLEYYPTAEAHTFLGWAYSFLGELDAAIAHCQQAIEMDPDFGNPYNDIGAYLIAQGRYEEAIPYLQQAIQAKRYNALHFAYFNLGRVYEHQDDWFNAYRAYRKALTLEPRYCLAHQSMERLRQFLVHSPVHGTP